MCVCHMCIEVPTYSLNRKYDCYYISKNYNVDSMYLQFGNHRYWHIKHVDQQSRLFTEILRQGRQLSTFFRLIHCS